jgi:hypothetical protein
MTTKKEKRTRAETKRLMWEYYSENKEWLPKWIREYREEILASLSNGGDVDTVFSEILKSVEQSVA